MKKLLMIFCLFFGFVKTASLEHCKFDDIKQKFELNDNLVKIIKSKIEEIFHWVTINNHDFKFKYLDYSWQFKDEDDGFLHIFVSWYKNEKWYSSLSPSEVLEMNQKVLELFRVYKSRLSIVDNNRELLKQICQKIDAEVEATIKEYDIVFENKKAYDVAFENFYSQMFEKVEKSFRHKYKLLSKHLRTRLMHRIHIIIEGCFRKRIKKPQV